MIDVMRLLRDRADFLEPVYSADDTAIWPSGLLEQLTAADILTRAANATSVVCDACAGDHVEEVIYVESPPGTGLRGYIRCPEVGRVRVRLERLQNWEVNYRCVAQLAAAVLSASGEVEEVVLSCVWLLGKKLVAGLPYEIFLCRMLNGAQGVSVVQKAARLRASPRPLILVVGGLPDESLWGGDVPLVLPLAAVMNWDGTTLACDHAQLEAAAGKRKKAKTPVVQQSFPTPQGASWEDVHIRMSDHRLHVEVLGKRKQFTFQEAGFEDRRRGNTSDTLWGLLRLFALHGGTLPAELSPLPPRMRTNLKQSISKLGKKLQALLLIKESPFKDVRVRRRYETRFLIRSDEELRFPTPAGLTWDEVSIAEIRIGVIAVRADSVATDGIYVAADTEAERPGSWEAAVRPGVIERHYDFCTIGLADKDRNPTPVGKALLDVLRSDGKVKRRSNDKTMLSLCQQLCALMNINESPFQYLETQQKWSALFEASSMVPGPAR